jgi:hypothetical protein
LVSILTPEIFQKIQINLNLDDHYSSLCVDRFSDFDKYKNVLPKHIQVSSLNFKIFKIKMVLDQIDSSILSFGDIDIKLDSFKNFDKLEIISNLAKKVKIIFQHDDDGSHYLKYFEDNYKSVTEILIIDRLRNH